MPSAASSEQVDPECVHLTENTHYSALRGTRASTWVRLQPLILTCCSAGQSRHLGFCGGDRAECLHLKLGGWLCDRWRSVANAVHSDAVRSKALFKGCDSARLHKSCAVPACLSSVCGRRVWLKAPRGPQVSTVTACLDKPKVRESCVNLDLRDTCLDAFLKYHQTA